MSCIITYNGQNFTQEDFLDYLKSQIPTSINNPSDFTNHSGGAKGGDTVWDQVGREFGVTDHNHYTVAYYDTLTQKEKNQLQEQYIGTVNFLKRGVINENTYSGKLVRRDMIQANNGDAIFGITELVKPGIKGRKGYINKTKYSIPEGGTGYAVARGILLNKPTYVFNQSNSYGNEIGWYVWDNLVKDFVKTETPTLTSNFTGIGSQEINDLGKQAIRDVYEKTFNQSEQGLNSPIASIPQNLISGQEAFGTLQHATPEVKAILGENPTSIDMIEAGLRTRTTRSVGEMEKYNIKVGDIIKHFGKSTDGKIKNIKARVTAIQYKGTPEFESTWYKEGWTQEGIKAIQRYKDGAAAIEFEIIKDEVVLEKGNLDTKTKNETNTEKKIEPIKPQSKDFITNKVNSSFDKYGYVDILTSGKNNFDFKSAVIKYILKDLGLEFKSDKELNSYLIKEKNEGRTFNLMQYVTLEELPDNKTRVKLNKRNLLLDSVEDFKPKSLGGLNFTSSGRDFESKNIFKNNIEQAFNCK